MPARWIIALQSSLPSPRSIRGGNHWSVGVALAEVIQAVCLLGGVAEHHHVTRLLPRVEQAPLEQLGAGGSVLVFDVPLAAEDLQHIGTVLLVTQDGDRLAEPGFTVLGEPTVVFVLVGEESIHYLNIVGCAVFGNSQLGGHCRRRPATELTDDALVFCGHGGTSRLFS